MVEEVEPSVRDVEAVEGPTTEHEIGHAIGLAHPGLYNGGSPTYDKDAFYQQDTHQYTVMSYFYADNTGADWRAGDGVWRYAQTPMVHDIMALQSIYGVETATRTGAAANKGGQ